MPVGGLLVGVADAEDNCPLVANPDQKNDVGGSPKGDVCDDTDNDGWADKATVFADGLNLATGLLLGNGGVYVGQAPDLSTAQPAGAPEASPATRTGTRLICARTPASARPAA